MTEEKYKNVMRRVLKREHILHEEENAVKAGIRVAFTVEKTGGTEEEAYKTVKKNIKEKLEENDSNAPLKSAVKKMLKRNKVNRRIDHLTVLVCKEVRNEMQKTDPGPDPDPAWCNVGEACVAMLGGADRGEEEHDNKCETRSRGSSGKSAGNRLGKDETGHKKMVEHYLAHVERDLSQKADEIMTSAVKRLQQNPSPQDNQDEKKTESRDESSQRAESTGGKPAEYRLHSENNTSKTGQTTGDLSEKGAKSSVEADDKHAGMDIGNSSAKETGSENTDSIFKGIENAFLLASKELKAQSYNWMLPNAAQEDSITTSRTQEEKLRELVGENNQNVSDEPQIDLDKGKKRETGVEVLHLPQPIKEFAAC